MSMRLPEKEIVRFFERRVWVKRDLMENGVPEDQADVQARRHSPDEQLEDTLILISRRHGNPWLLRKEAQLIAKILFGEPAPVEIQRSRLTETWSLHFESITEMLTRKKAVRA